MNLERTIVSERSGILHAVSLDVGSNESVAHILGC